MNGAEAIVQALIECDVQHIFGIPGATVIPVYDEFLNQQKYIQHILVRHEQAAAHAADAYARVTGKAGVCMATSGPGATNLVTGLMTAHMDSSPVIALAGQVPIPLIGRDAFQETDMIGMTMPITKHNFMIRDPNKIRSTIKRAFEIALQGRPGPVFIDLPKDIQIKSVERENIDVGGGIPRITPTPRSDDILAATQMILHAERPLFVIGGGLIWSNASEELIRLVEVVHAPVATTIMGKGAFPESHPLSVGPLGMHGRRIANYAMTNADLLIVIGSRWSDRVVAQPKIFQEKRKIIHVDIDASEIHKNIGVNVSIVADAKAAITELRRAILSKGIKRHDSEWNQRISRLTSCCDCSEERPSKPITSKITMYSAMLKLRKIIQSQDIVTTGVGQHQMFATHFLKRDRPRTFITSGGAGAMGFGLPAAIGAKFARPNVNVFDIDGDGAFNMTLQELATVKQHGLKVIPIIFNNGYLGMVRQWLELFKEKRYSEVDLGREIDFIKIADGYGLPGSFVKTNTEFDSALKEAISSDETYVIECLIPREENILPMIKPGQNCDQSLGGCMPETGQFFTDQEIKNS